MSGLSSCEKETLSEENINKSSATIPQIENESSQFNNLSNDEIYMEFSEAVFNLHNALNTLDISDLDAKNQQLILAAADITEVTLEEFIDLHHSIYQVDRSIFEDYFYLINEYATLFASDKFEPEYLEWLDKNLPESSVTGTQVSTRWFLAALSELLGASDCVSAVLGVIDTAAHVATGILTAPTGVGAVATWGGAATSYAGAFANADGCLHPDNLP